MISLILQNTHCAGSAPINYNQEEILGCSICIREIFPNLFVFKITIFTDHYALRYLMVKKDAKA